MGMFDSVMFKCPKCGHRIEAQSKSGPCDLDVYEQDKIPQDVLESLTIYGPCRGCNTRFKFSDPKPVILPVEFYSVDLIQLRDDEYVGEDAIKISKKEEDDDYVIDARVFDWLKSL